MCFHDPRDTYGSPFMTRRMNDWYFGYDVDVMRIGATSER